MGFMKKEVRLFGVLHGAQGLSMVTQELKPFLKKGGKIALELTPGMTDFFERLLVRGLPEEKLVSAIEARLKGEAIGIYGRGKIPKGFGYSTADFRAWFEIYRLAREKGMKVVPLDSKSLHKKTSRMKTKQDKIERPLIKSQGQAGGIERFSMRPDPELEKARDNPFYRKLQQTKVPAREAHFGEVIEKEKPDLVVCGTVHPPGLEDLKLRGIKWKTGSEILMLSPEMRHVGLARQNNQQTRKNAPHLKTTQDRPASQPFKKTAAKTKKTRKQAKYAERGS
ncbi:MAG: hypothetical protein NT067_05275 [Candidatus Diapherotrites archaeon]|nr:hypothetical protein [Candidatus Diapherotrites archaeon]